MSEQTATELLFDAAHLAQYTLGDKSLEEEVLQMFIDQADIYLQRLQQAGSIDEWRESAHSLKGSARGVGAFRLGAVAERMEKLQTPFEQIDRDALVAAIRHEASAASAAMQQHLHKSE